MAKEMEKTSSKKRSLVPWRPFAEMLIRSSGRIKNIGVEVRYESD
jgi:hypothetical protein